MAKVVRKGFEQLEELDRNEKSRFTNGEPASPFDAEDQANTFDHGEQAVKNRAASEPDNVGRGDMTDLIGQIREKGLFRIEMKKFQRLVKLVRQIAVKVIHPQGQQEEQEPFAELHRNDDVERRGATRLFGWLGGVAHKATTETSGET